MARIAENLLLLLLDNESAQPRVQRGRLGRLLAAALLLDLAYDCRVRPALPGEPFPAGRLVALAGPVPMDPAVRPALEVLHREPATPAGAIARLRRRATDDVLDQLLRTGQIRQVQLSSHRLLRNTYAWPVRDRTQVDRTRAAIAGPGQGKPDAVTAAVVALLGTIGGLGPLLDLDADAAQRADQRARDITFGATDGGAGTAELNLAVTAAAVLPALG